MKYIETTRQLHVTGYLWGGGKGLYNYTVKDPAPTTLIEANKIAGDFESLITAKIITIHREVTETVMTKHLK